MQSILRSISSYSTCLSAQILLTVLKTQLTVSPFGLRVMVMGLSAKDKASLLVLSFNTKTRGYFFFKLLILYEVLL